MSSVHVLQVQVLLRMSLAPKRYTISAHLKVTPNRHPLTSPMTEMKISTGTGSTWELPLMWLDLSPSCIGQEANLPAPL